MNVGWQDIIIEGSHTGYYKFMIAVLPECAYIFLTIATVKQEKKLSITSSFTSLEGRTYQAFRNRSTAH